MKICRKVKNPKIIAHIDEIKSGELFKQLNTDTDYVYMKISTDIERLANSIRLNDGLLIYVGINVDIVKIDGELLVD